VNGETPDNVIAIETRFTEAPPVDWKPRDYLSCQHEHTMLDEVLRTVGCRDCGEERLDLFEVLLHLARTWRRWQYEAEQLHKLNTEYNTNRRETWERSRDRHIGANPDHKARYWTTMADGFVAPREFVDTDGGARLQGGMTMPQDCRPCYGLYARFDSRWMVRRKPEPPPGKLEPA
jgi:hypothetical protein